MVVILLFNVKELFNVGGGALLDRLCIPTNVRVVFVLPLCALVHTTFLR